MKRSGCAKRCGAKDGGSDKKFVGQFLPNDVVILHIGVAQLVEQQFRKLQVAGSSPAASFLVSCRVGGPAVQFGGGRAAVS